MKNRIFFKDTDSFAISIKYLDKIVECLNCKNEYNEERLNLLEKIITYHFLKLPPENKELYYNLLNFQGSIEEFIEALSESNSRGGSN